MRTLRLLSSALTCLALAACSSDPVGIAIVEAGTGVPGFDGDGKDVRTSRLYSPLDVAFAPDGTLWVVDFNNHRLRTREADGTWRTRVGDLMPGDGDPATADLTTGAAGTTVLLNHPTDLTFAPDGALLFSAWHNFKIRHFDPATGLVRVIAGGRHPMGGFAGDGGPASEAAFNFPKSLARLADGTLYVLDQRNLRIRRVSAGTEPTVATIAGDGTAGDTDGPATTARFRWEQGTVPMPSGALALGPDGALYIADSLNHKIRRLDLITNTVSTIAGTGEAGLSGDGGAPLAARLHNPRDIAFASDGRLFVADTDNDVVRAIDLKTSVITTVLGTGVQGTGTDGSEATDFALSHPWGLTFDADGRLHVADTENHRLVRVRL